MKVSAGSDVSDSTARAKVAAGAAGWFSNTENAIMGGTDSLYCLIMDE